MGIRMDAKGRGELEGDKAPYTHIRRRSASTCSPSPGGLELGPLGAELDFTDRVRKR